MARQSKKQRGVFERPAGSGIWWICYHDQYGRKHREKVGFRQTAIEIYRQRKTEIRLGKFVPEDIQRRNADVAEIIEDKLASSKLLRSYASDYQRLGWWKERFGDHAARSIKPGDIEQARLELAKEREVSTCNRYLQALKAAYSLAVKNGKVERNPVKEIRLQKENNCRVCWLTDEEQIRLFEVLPTEYKPRVILALHTGLRRMELFSLQWSALNLQQRLITVRESKSGESRVIPMNDTVYETLRRIPRKIDSPYVFPGKLPNSHVTDLPKSWEKFLDKAGILDFKWHDLRHTFASRLVMAGVDLYTVKKLLGHHEIKMTERYAHLAPGYLKDAVNLLSIPGAQVTPKLTPTESRIS